MILDPAMVIIGSNVVAAGNHCRVLRAITEEDKLKYQNTPSCVHALKSVE